MSPAFGRAAGDHDRAQELAAIRVDEPLGAIDESWLDAHLETCVGCRVAASDFEADRSLFGPLRVTPPVPPRDLWARTAAAIDAEAGGRTRRTRRRLFGLPALTLAPVAGFAAVAIVVGAGLLNGSPVAPQPLVGSGPPPTPIALAPGDVAVLSRGADGSYQVQTGVVDEVCPLAAATCAARPSFEATELATIGGADSVGAIISPARDRLVVVQRGATGADGVYAVPVKSGGSGTATATPRPSQEPATSASATSAPPTTDPSAEPSGSPAASPSPDAPAGSPPASAAPSLPPEVTPPVGATATPVASEEPRPDPTPAVAVTPDPDGGGAIQIARDVIVVGGVAAYSADGSHFAFTARPADGSAGPNVYVWDTSTPLARAVTTDHRSVFAGWDGRELLVSRLVNRSPRTFHLSARTGAVRDERGHAAWLPTVAPDGAHAAWWDGSVTLADDDLTLALGKGRVVLGGWPDTSGDQQVLAKGSLAAFEVRWSADGSVIGVWTAAEGDANAGRLSLYPVDPATGRARLDAPILDDAAAYAGFAIEDGRVVYPGPGTDDARSLWVVAWEDGAVVGRVELVGEGGATVIR